MLPSKRATKVREPVEKSYWRLDKCWKAKKMLEEDVIDGVIFGWRVFFESSK